MLQFIQGKKYYSIISMIAAISLIIKFQYQPKKINRYFWKILLFYSRFQYFWCFRHFHLIFFGNNSLIVDFSKKIVEISSNFENCWEKKKVETIEKLPLSRKVTKTALYWQNDNGNQFCSIKLKYIWWKNESGNDCRLWEL